MLKLGIFMMPIHPANKNLVDCLEEDRNLVIKADKLNYSEAWMGEHYSSSGEPVPSPFIFNASLISETKQIKFGTGVISLPQQHPAIVAGHAALFDNLSKGRFLFGVGAGGLVSDWELFDNLDGKTRALTMLDSIDAILSIWNSNEALNYKSDFINFKVENNYIPELGIGTFIKPFQKPHPPIAVSLKNANSMTAKFAGKKGWIPISGNFVPAEDIATHWPTYLEGARESGKKGDYDSWRVGRSVLITETSQQANDILNDPEGIFTDYFLYLNTVGKLASGISKNEINIEEEKQASILKARDLIIIGTEKEVLDKLINFIDIVGPFGTLLLTGHDHYGWKELWSNTLVQMSENIRPKLDNYIKNLETLPAAE